MGFKSLKHSEAVLEDRISELPDAILCHMLSFLETKDAVKTAVLSRRWKNIWVFVPNISLYDTDEECALGSELENVKQGFEGFVDRVLFAVGSYSNIHRFKLCCRGICDYSRIDGWIHTAIMSNVVELDLNFAQNHKQPVRFEFPKSLFMSRTLVSLKLYLRPNFIVIPPTSDSFPSLKSLKVQYSSPDVHSIEKLVSCCPVIEDLSMRGSLSPAHGYHFKVSAPKLKILYTSFNEFFDQLPVYFDVDAPNLEKFVIFQRRLAIYTFHNAKSLHEAHITFGKTFERGPGFSDRIQGLFAGIADVEYLSVSAETFRGHLLPTFNNLTKLVLTRGYWCSWQLLTNFLKVSPSLEYLQIQSVCNDLVEGELAGQWIPPESVPISLLSCLKDVCVELEGWPGEIEIIEYLLKHGKVLNNMIIDSRFCCNWTEEERKVMKAISMCPRGSMTCQIFLNGQKFAKLSS